MTFQHMKLEMIKMMDVLPRCGTGRYTHTILPLLHLFSTRVHSLAFPGDSPHMSARYCMSQTKTG